MPNLKFQAKRSFNMDDISDLVCYFCWWNCLCQILLPLQFNKYIIQFIALLYIIIYLVIISLQFCRKYVKRYSRIRWLAFSKVAVTFLKLRTWTGLLKEYVNAFCCLRSNSYHINIWPKSNNTLDTTFILWDNHEKIKYLYLFYCN